MESWEERLQTGLMQSEKVILSGFTDHLNEGGGAGPFMVSQYIHHQELDFILNPNYNGPKPHLQKVIVSVYKDVNALC